jgi:hypothetical protein
MTRFPVCAGHDLGPKLLKSYRNPRECQQQDTIGLLKIGLIFHSFNGRIAIKPVLMGMDWLIVLKLRGNLHTMPKFNSVPLVGAESHSEGWRYQVSQSELVIALVLSSFSYAISAHRQECATEQQALLFGNTSLAHTHLPICLV